MEKIVYQTDFAGVYVNQVVADESPLEPGVFLVPAGCVEVAPPAVGPYQWARWEDDKWVLETSRDDPVTTPETPIETPVTAKEFEAAIQEHLDNTAQISGYDNIQTAVSYAAEPSVIKFQLDGLAFRLWRSLVWAHAYEQLALVESESITAPSIEDFILDLPKLVLPVSALSAGTFKDAMLLEGYPE